MSSDAIVSIILFSAAVVGFFVNLANERRQEEKRQRDEIIRAMRERLLLDSGMVNAMKALIHTAQASSYSDTRNTSQE